MECRSGAEGSKEGENDGGGGASRLCDCVHGLLMRVSLRPTGRLDLPDLNHCRLAPQAAHPLYLSGQWTGVQIRRLSCVFCNGACRAALVRCLLPLTNAAVRLHRLQMRLPDAHDAANNHKQRCEALPVRIWLQLQLPSCARAHGRCPSASCAALMSDGCGRRCVPAIGSDAPFELLQIEETKTHFITAKHRTL